MSIGFGIERLGLLALKYPKVAGFLVLAFTALTVSALPRATVDGDLLRVYKDSGQMYDRYEKLTETFGTFDNDAYVMVKSKNLTDPKVLETLRTLAFDLELNDYAAGTLSPFSLRKPAGDNVTLPAVPENMKSAQEVAKALTELRSNDPIMRNLIAQDLTSMVMIVFPDKAKTRGSGERDMIASLKRLVSEYRSDNIQIELTGAPIWKTEILDASINDQIKFSIYGVVIGFLTAFISFRTFWGAILATLTPFVSVIWVAGTVILLFGSFTFLTNIVTTLVLVIAFAESMFFCFTWLRLWRDGMEPHEAVRQTVHRVSPACALASITTIIAFASLALTQGQGIKEFALSGVIAVIIAYVTLVTFLPLALKLAIHLGYKSPRAPSVALTAPIPLIKMITGRFRKQIAIVAILTTAVLFIPHFNLEPRFSFQDFLPPQSESLAVAKQIDSGVGGVSPIYIRVPLSQGLQSVGDADYEKIQKVHDILEANIGKGKVISAASFGFYSESGFTRAQIFNAVGPVLKRRFVTDDGKYALVTGFLPTIIKSEELRTFVNKTDSQLRAAGLGDAQVSGFRVLTSFASMNMIRSMQQGLTLAVFISIFVIGLAFKSWKVALVAFVPNILPILGTELYLWLTNSGLQLTTVIALTISFGIAVDDTIHFLAHYKRARHSGLEHEPAVIHALERVGPALIATTLILCAGTFIVIFSSLPQVALFGTLTVLTLLLALVGDLIILPAMLLAGGRFFNSLGGLKK
ncbi:hypothetical protein MNBD_ALPHA12-92 [hydrothermal vent metagenome]|uniref:SSD domain-containing protein n=1 Tax=hydrothermal vent metagenome TaxID=652676 RepID=A0A3B0UAV7_9ZZZZ